MEAGSLLDKVLWTMLRYVLVSDFSILLSQNGSPQCGSRYIVNLVTKKKTGILAFNGVEKKTYVACGITGTRCLAVLQASAEG